MRENGFCSECGLVLKAAEKTEQNNERSFGISRRYELRSRLWKVLALAVKSPAAQQQTNAPFGNPSPKYAGTGEFFIFLKKLLI